MRSSKQGFMVLAAFLAGCAASGVTSVLIPPIRAGTTPPRWEYIRVESDSNSRAVPPTMNAYGAQGWELVTAIHAGSYAERCFKRPLP